MHIKKCNKDIAYIKEFITFAALALFYLVSGIVFGG